MVDISLIPATPISSVRGIGVADMPSTSTSLGHDPVGDVIDRVAGAVVALGRDARVEHHLQQHVAEFLAEGLLIARLEGVERLVGLLQQVRGQGLVGLPGVPGAFHPQPVHGRHQVEQVRARQVSRTAQQPGPGRDRRIVTRLGQPHHRLVDSERRPAALHHLVSDPRLVQRGQQRMAGRGEHGGGRPQRLPGRPAEQAGRHPGAGREDDQQAGVSPEAEAVGAGPPGRNTVPSAATIASWL